MNHQPTGPRTSLTRLAVLILAAVGLVAPLVFLSRLRPSDDVPTTITAASPEPERELSLPPGGPAFHPATYNEGQTTVMPVTFPDGSIAELMYPSELELERASVYPAVYIERGPRSCANVIMSRSNMAGDVYEGERPIAVFQDARGEPVGLWRSKGAWEPYTWLVIPLDSWILAVNCYPEERYVAPDSFGPPLLPAFDEEEVAVWASGVDGRETADGFLLMTPREPLRLGDWDFNTGPTLRFSFEGERPAIVDIGLEGCDPEDDWDPDGNQEVAQWCVPPGVRVYALGTPESLDALAAGLQIRNFVRAPTA